MAIRDDAEPGIQRVKGSTAATIYKNGGPVAPRDPAPTGAAVGKTVVGTSISAPTAAPIPQPAAPTTTEHPPPNADDHPGFTWVERKGDIPGHWERSANAGKTPPPAEVRDHRDDEKKAIEGPGGTIILVDKGLTTSKDEPGGQIKIDPEKVKAAEEAASKKVTTDNRAKPKAPLPTGTKKPLPSGTSQGGTKLSPMLIAAGVAAAFWLISES